MKKIKSRINKKLDVAGILLTMCDARTILCKTITEQVTETFQGQIRIFKSKIPNTVKVGECEDGDLDSSSVLSGASYDPFEEME